jgi:hypothetical protein
MRPSSDLVILVLVLLAAVALYVAGAWLATIPCTPGSRGFAIGPCGSRAVAVKARRGSA